MTRKKCGFGLSCAALMLQPDLEATDCPNYQTCGSASELLPEEEVELIRVREVQRQEAQQQWEHLQERIQVSRQSAALMMLRERGCPQLLENLGISQLMASIERRIQEVRSRLEPFTADGYVAPDHVEAHCYNVKRPSRTYWYNKLTSRQVIFEPEAKQEKVKVIHLSHDDDPRNIEGRLGIERRNRLHQLQTQLQTAEAALNQAIALVNEPLALVLADNESLDS